MVCGSYAEPAGNEAVTAIIGSVWSSENHTSSPGATLSDLAPKACAAAGISAISAAKRSAFFILPPASAWR